MSDTRQLLAELTGGIAAAMYLLVEELEKKDVLSRQEFAETLRDLQDRVATIAAEESDNPERGDTMLFKALVEILERPNAPAWSPTIIDGGKDD